MSSAAVKKGLNVLVGEGEDVLKMLADSCESPLAWERILQGPLELACLRGKTRLVTKFVLAGAKVTHRSFNNAARSHRWDTLLELLSRTRRDKLVKVRLLQTLYIAVGKGQIGIVRALLEADVIAKLGKALIIAVRDAGDAAEEIVGELLDQPGAAHVIDWFGHGKENPLLIASRRGLHRICSMLIGKGAHVNAQISGGGPTPLHGAVAFGDDLVTAKVLLQAGADPNVACGRDGRTAVHTACQHGDTAAGILGALIEHGADVKVVDNRNTTPLHIASGVAPSCTETIGLLVNAGADVNARKLNGSTPLHSAASHLRPDAVRHLLWHGADETLVTDNGNCTPLDVVGKRVAQSEALAIFGIVRKLLIGAPVERAWRRRSCIVLCHARCTSTVYRNKRVCSRHSDISAKNDGFGEIVRAVSDDVFRKIVGFL